MNPASPRPPRRGLTTAIAAAAAVAALAAPTSSSSPSATNSLQRVLVDPATHLFQQADGRYVLFHGDNVVAKGPAPAVLTPAQMNNFVDFGFNVVRYGWTWNAYETAPGVFNETFMDVIEAEVDRFGEAGVHVFLDPVHQDDWSSLYCGAHGIPEWYSYPAAPDAPGDFAKGGKKAYPRPLVQHVSYAADDKYSGPFGVVDGPTCDAISNSAFGWASTYATEAVSSAAQRFYDDKDGGLTAFAAMWTRLANRFKSKPHVLGYELINEPWLGDIYADPLLLVGGGADRNLQPVYEKLATAIRAVDNDTIIAFEPASGGNILDTPPVGFTSNPVAGPNAGGGDLARSMLSYHVYCPLIESDMPYGANKTLLNILYLGACDLLNGYQFATRVNDVKRIGGGGMLTEWGAESISQWGKDVLHYTLDMQDKHLSSWIFWGMSPDEGAFEAESLARTYPRVVAGTPLRLSFDNATRTMTFAFAPPADAAASLFALPTEVFCSTTYTCTGADGPTWSASPAGAMQGVWNASRQVLFLTLAPSAAGLPNVSVTVAP